MILGVLCLNAVDEDPDEEREGVLPPPGEFEPPPIELEFMAVPFVEPEEPETRPAVERFELPSVERYLPPRARRIPSIEVTGFRFTGNSVFSEEELEEVISDFRGKMLMQEDLDGIRYHLTQHYVTDGYLNSGARIPDQELEGGVLEIEIVEGHLTDVITMGNEGLSDRYLSSRILVDNDKPLHFPTLQRRLQVMQVNPNIGRLNAELKPGLMPGEALMTLEVEENPKWSYGVDFHNQRSPSVGGEQLDLWLENRNVTGYSDTFRGRLGLFSGDPDDLEFAGLDNLFLQYERPILGDDTSVLLAWQTEDYSILEEPFRSLAIDGESWSLTGGLRKPVYRTLRDEVWLSLLLEKSRDETYVLGRPFSISPGSVNGKLDLSILRLGGEWTRRTRKSVLAMRTALAYGFDGLGATSQPTEPDGEFLAWTLDGQYSRRVHERGDLVVVHGGFQFADGPLTPPAQMRIGGRYTVRGYRENFLVRDNGLYAGVDYQFPLMKHGESGGWDLWAVPFLDAGVGWNDGTSQRRTVISVGLGLKAAYSDWFRGELFWGVPLKDNGRGSGNLQDDGIHFRMSFARF